MSCVLEKGKEPVTEFVERLASDPKARYPKGYSLTVNEMIRIEEYIVSDPNPNPNPNPNPDPDSRTISSLAISITIQTWS